MDKYSNNRIEWLDSIRGVAILLVVLGHIIPMEYGLGRYIYSFHVPLFFIISGYLYGINKKWKKVNFNSYIVKGICKNLYPYFVFSIFSLIICLASYGRNYFIISLLYTIIGEGIETLWFLPALFLAELIFVYLFRKESVEIKVIGLVFIYIVSSLLSQFDYKNIVNWGNIKYLLKTVNVVNRSMIGTLFLFVGYCYSKVEKYINKRMIWEVTIFIIFGGLSFIGAFYSNVDIHYSQVGNVLLFYTNAIMGSLFWMFLIKKLLSKNQFLIFWGKNSLIVLTTHINFRIVKLGNDLFSFVEFDYIKYFLIYVLVLLIEWILILLINKYFVVLIHFPQKKN